MLGQYRQAPVRHFASAGRRSRGIALHGGRDGAGSHAPAGRAGHRV